MCNDFSGLVTQSRQVIWKRGVSSHDTLYSMFKKNYSELASDHRYVKFEVAPDGGYLYPEKDWSFNVDEREIPDWFSDEHKKECLREHRKWKKETYALINLEEARNPINPLVGRAKKPTKKDIELLKEWDSVGASVRASVRASVGDSVRASVGDSVGASVRASVGFSVGASVWASVGASVWASVWAYTGSLFDIWGGEYKFQPAVDLWKRGFVASFDGTAWRLHSGKSAEIVYKWKV